jgi:hypothetical protein
MPRRKPSGGRQQRKRKIPKIRRYRLPKLKRQTRENGLQVQV